AELETMAQRALLQSGVRDFTKLHVEVRDAVATLYGRLPTDIERQLVVQMIRRVNGIVRVDHEVSVDEIPEISVKRSSRVGQRLGWWAAWSLIGIFAAALIGALAI